EDILKKRHLIITLFITIGAFYYTFKNITIVELLNALSSIHFLSLIPAIFIIILSYLFRAIRWRYLVAPLKSSIKTSNLFSPLMVGFMGNLLPARAGEFIRAYLLGKKEGLSFSSSFATVFVERLFDLLVLMFIMTGLLIFRSDIFLSAGSFRDVAVINILHKFGLITLALSVGIIFFSYLLIHCREKILYIVRFIIKPLPDRFSYNLIEFINSFVEGLNILKDIRSLFFIILFSIIVWACMITTYYPFYVAFQFNGLPYISILVLMVVIGVLITILPTPGFLGSYQAACVIGLHEIYKVTEVDAINFGIITWFIQTGVVFALGLFFIMKENISFKELAKGAMSNE
ncbi:MAG: flippase-like domain-containing protein, partial [Nitrospinae bacterium]|nr:flippase-like domain-containing protein [Nitrospinota bacterium]